MLGNVIVAIGFIALSAQTAGLAAPPAPSASVIAATANARAFASAAALSDIYEMQAGQLALKKAESMDVRDFAQMMVADHSETTARLRRVLATSAPDILVPLHVDPRHMFLLDELIAADGTGFDQRYIAQQISAHQEALMLMQTYARTGENRALNDFAEETASIVARHLDMITQIDTRHRGISSR
jgi:putative membrane protein